MKTAEAAIPRITLLFSDLNLLQEVERALHSHYSSLLIVSETEKLKEFQTPLLIIADNINTVSEIGRLQLPKGTRVLILLEDKEGEEEIGAAFESGADTFIYRSFTIDDLLEKTEEYLAPFRKTSGSR